MKNGDKQRITRIGKHGNIARMFNPKFRTAPTACNVFPIIKGEKDKKAILNQERKDASILTHTMFLKSVKLIKTKTESMAELIGDERSTNNQETKQTKSEFHFCNILPIPHVLTKAYLELDTFDPQTVALAFYSAMSEFDQKETDTQPNQDTEIVPPLQDERETDNTRLLDNSDEQSTSSNHQLE